MYQHQNILCYQLSATIIIHEQRLFANFKDINFAYYTYMYTWFTEDGTINFYFYLLCLYLAGTLLHLLQVQLPLIKPKLVLEFGKKSCSVVHLLFLLELIWNIGKILIKLRLHRLLSKPTHSFLLALQHLILLGKTKFTSNICATEKRCFSLYVTTFKSTTVQSI